MQQEIEFDPENHFTYLRAAKELDRSIESIQKAVSAGVLHPIRLRSANTRYILRDEIEWFKDKPLTPAIAAAYQQLKETREELEEIKRKVQDDRFFMLLALVGVGLGLFSKTENKHSSVHTTFIEAMKQMEADENYPTLAKELGSTLFDLARKEELTFSERRIISELSRILTMSSEDLSRLVS